MGRFGRGISQVCSVVSGLPVKVLGSTANLIYDSLGLGLSVAGNTPETFFSLSARVSDGSRNTIFVHWMFLALEMMLLNAPCGLSF